MLLIFFQAEDGIRDTSVTGVQTCALPIWLVSATPIAFTQGSPPLEKRTVFAMAFATSRSPDCKLTLRSEERRVGKECRVLYLVGSYCCIDVVCGNDGCCMRMTALCVSDEP